MCMRMRRATRYEPPLIQAAGTDSSPFATQTCSARPAGSSSLRLFVPSLNPNMLRGVAWAVEVEEVRPKPSWLHRTETTPNPSRTRLRTACTATCGSLAHAWMQRSPPERFASSWSPTKAGRFSSAAGLRPASPKRPSNNDGPKPIVIVRPDAGSP